MAVAMAIPEPEKLKRKSDIRKPNITAERLSVARTVLRLAKQYDALSIPEAAS